MLLGGVPHGVLVVVPGLAQHGVGDVVLAGAVGLHDGGHHVLRHVLVVGQQLLGVLGQAVAAVAKAGVVVIVADARVQTHALNDLPCIQPAAFGVGVQFVEVGHTQCKVAVGKQFDGLRFRKAHEQRRDVRIQRTFGK